MKNILELIDIIRRETNTSANTAQRIADTMEAIVLRCNECERGNGSGLVNVEAGNVVTGTSGSAAEVSVQYDEQSKTATLYFTIPTGENGEAAKNLELRNGITHIQWRLEGETESDWKDLIRISELKGEQGESATITVGEVTTAESGTPASVINTGTEQEAILDFVIPKGEPGETATIAIGSVTTAEAGTSASVTNSGTEQEAVFDFVIPRGEQGAPGNGLAPEPNSFPAFNLNGELRMLKNYQEYSGSYVNICEYAKLIKIMADIANSEFDVYINIGYESVFECLHEMTIIVQNHGNRFRYIYINYEGGIPILNRNTESFIQFLPNENFLKITLSPTPQHGNWLALCATYIRDDGRQQEYRFYNVLGGNYIPINGHAKIFNIDTWSCSDIYIGIDDFIFQETKLVFFNRHNTHVYVYFGGLMEVIAQNDYGGNIIEIYPHEKFLTVSLCPFLIDGYNPVLKATAHREY